MFHCSKIVITFSNFLISYQTGLNLDVLSFHCFDWLQIFSYTVFVYLNAAILVWIKLSGLPVRSLFGFYNIVSFSFCRTADEDFSMLLGAAVMYDRRVAAALNEDDSVPQETLWMDIYNGKQYPYPRLLFIITGKDRFFVICINVSKSSCKT